MVVDLNRCQGYAQWCFLAPETFKLVGEEGLCWMTIILAVDVDYSQGVWMTTKT
jgi:hypothetical protein